MVKSATPQPLMGVTLLAATANIIMQLSHPAVAYGVMESKVPKGSFLKTPYRRLRTTITYLDIATTGTDAERKLMREQLNAQHRQVVSTASSPVKYNAFSRDLQLWVAACLYRGRLDAMTVFYGESGTQWAEEQYAESARLATTLQVPEDMWPEDRAAFERYWKEQVASIHIDDTTREYLAGALTVRSFGGPVAAIAGPVNRFFTVGFLPPEFRSEMKLTWTESDQRRFEIITRVIGSVHRRLPRVARQFPYNMYGWDARRRLRKGIPLF